MNKKTMRAARSLAIEMNRIENEILSYQVNNKLLFDVYEMDGAWMIVTQYCQMGGCICDYISRESEELAKYESAKMSYFGKEPKMNGLCVTCRNELNEMQI